MKKVYTILSAAFALLTVSCTDSYDKYNKEGIDDQEGARKGYLLRTHLTNMEGYIIAQEDAQNQYTEQLLGGPYGGYITDVKPFSNPFSRYNPESGWIESSFKFVMSKPVTSYKNVISMSSDPLYSSIAKLLRLMALARLTDTYGPIPYSDLEKDGQLNAAYDPQDKVYNQMIVDLNNIIENLTSEKDASISPSADLYYGGVILNWVRLANSVKLRLAMRMSDVNPSLAQKSAEEVVNHEVGPFQTNQDNAILKIPAGIINPYQQGLFNWGDSRISADITTYMNGYNDPRRPAYFNTTTMAGYTNDYIGIRTGIALPDKETGMLYSNMSTKLATQNSMIIMTSAEVAFLKAEGALRGWSMGGSAQDFYEQGVRLSFEQWGVSDKVDAYLADNSSTVTPYVDPRGVDSFSGTPSKIKIAWDNASTTEANLERIITQKWIALYPNGMEAWAEYRRTGYPKLMPVVVNNSTVVSTERMVRRLPFPQSEYTSNKENVLKAVTYLDGPDNMATDLWWAKKK